MSYLILPILLTFQFFIQENKPVFTKSPEDYLPPPKAIQHFTSGLKIAIADSLWLRALQDFDYCNDKINERDCVGQSWLFQVLDLATTLDPKFEPVMYQTGGLALTVIISDYAGASIYFDRGVEQYPNDWQLNYAAAYHVLYEEKNKAKAAKLYLAAADNGAPPWVRVMAGRLGYEGGDKVFAEQVLQQMIDTNQDEKLIEVLKRRLSKLKAETAPEK